MHVIGATPRSYALRRLCSQLMASYAFNVFEPPAEGGGEEPPPPPPSPSAPTGVTPTVFFISTATAPGVIGVLSAVGGYPTDDPSTITLGGADAANFEIVGNNLTLLNTIESAGDLNITFSAANSTGAQPSPTPALVSVSAATDLTVPDIANLPWPQVDVFYNEAVPRWEVQTTQVPSIVGNYTAFSQIEAAAFALGGQIKIKFVNDFATTEALRPTSNTAPLAVIGNRDADGEPTVFFSAVYEKCAWAAPTQYYIKDIEFGVPNALVKGPSKGTNSRAVVLLSPGKIWGSLTFTPTSVTCSIGTWDTYFAIGDTVMPWQALFSNMWKKITNLSGNVMTVTTADMEFADGTIEPRTSHVWGSGTTATGGEIWKMDRRFPGWLAGPQYVAGGDLIAGGGASGGAVELICDNIRVRNGSGDGGVGISNAEGILLGLRRGKMKAWNSKFWYCGGDNLRHLFYIYSIEAWLINCQCVGPNNGGHTFKTLAHKSVAVDTSFCINDGDDDSISVRHVVPAGSEYVLPLDGSIALDSGGSIVEFRDEFGALVDKDIKLTWFFNASDRTITVTGETAAGVPVVSKQWGDLGSTDKPKYSIMPHRAAKITQVHLSSGSTTGTVFAGDGTVTLTDNNSNLDVFTNSRARFSGCAVDDDRLVGGGIWKTHTRPYRDFDELGDFPGGLDVSGGLVAAGAATALNQFGLSQTTFLAYTALAASAGANALTSSALTRFPNNREAVVPEAGVDYTCRVEYDGLLGVDPSDREKGEFVGRFTGSVFTFNSGTLAKSVASTRRLAFKKASDPWDGWRVEERYANPAHPDYYFRTPTGPERSDWLTHYIIDCSVTFGRRTFGGGTTYVLQADALQSSWIDWGPAGWRASLPSPPWNDTQSPPRWAYDPTFSDVSEPLMATGKPIWGRQGSRNDYAWTTTVVLGRVGVYKRPGSHSMILVGALQASAGSSEAYRLNPPFPDYRLLNTDGTLKTATFGDSDWPTLDGTELLGNHVSGATSFQTAGLPPGLSVGCIAQIWLRPFKPGRKPLLQVPITGLPGGDVFQIAAPGLPHNILNRSEVAFIPAHTAPVDGWFMTLDQFATR